MSASNRILQGVELNFPGLSLRAECMPEDTFWHLINTLRSRDAAPDFPRKPETEAVLLVLAQESACMTAEINRHKRKNKE